MEKHEHIWIAPKRGRLPRRYEVSDTRTFQQKLRILALWLFLGALFWAGVIYLAVKR